MSYGALTWRGGVGSSGLLLALLAGCGRTDSRPAAAPAAPAPVAPAPPPPPPPPFLPVAIDSGAPFRELLRELGPDRLTLLLKVNRVDLAHVRAGDTLALPADSAVGELDLAPFPRAVAGLDSVPRFLAVSQRIQAWAAYEAGRLVFWGPTSTGKKSTPTPNGLFFTNWKAKETRSTDNQEWLLRWYFNIENRRGVSFHEYGLPGVPASHACIRLLPSDAEWIYHWADQWKVSRDGRTVLLQGTPVLLFGEYDFDQPGPWRRLLDDPDAARVTESELESALVPARERILLETRRRDSAR